jgi:S1-C subfamily serine protease
MSHGLRRLFSLAVVFAIAFLAVILIRNGPSGLTRLFRWGQPTSENGFRPEKYTLPDKAPLEAGDVELLARLDSEYEKLTEAVTPSVVSIDTAGVRDERQIDFLGRQSIRSVPSQGQGSGVIVSNEGHIVTNHHVIAGQQQIQVRLHDGRKFPATLVGDDVTLDIAVLKIDGDGTPFRPLKFGDSSLVRRGQLVFAIGNPFGLGETITQGIISAVERTISENQRDLFQTDAAINPGNSGGPLVNLRGEIIGINSTIYSSDVKHPSFQGVGFSIPSNDVKDTLSSILERGRPIWGYLGVEMLPSEQGVIIGAVVPGGPAASAGLQGNDVVMSYDGEKITNRHQLFNLVHRTKTGKTIPVQVMRNGSQVTVQVTVAESNPEEIAARNRELADQDAQAQSRNRDILETVRAIGVKVSDLSTRDRARGFSGVVVMEVVNGSLAAPLLLPGDLVVALNDTQVNSAREFYLQVAASAAVQPTVIHFIRDGQVKQVEMPALPKKSDEPEGTK